MLKSFILLCALIFGVTASANYFGEGNSPYLYGVYFQKHLTEQESKGVVILTHGVLEHSGRYGSLIEVINQQGLDVYRYDLRGHGKSYGVRGHINKFESFVDDLERMVNKASLENPDLPIYLFGHSMGGLITYKYLARESSSNKVSAAILSAPALNLPPMSATQSAKLALAPIARMANGKMLAGEGIATSKLSDIDLSEELANDPLMTDDFTISLGHELTMASQSIQEEGIRPFVSNIPLLFIQGSEDQVVYAQANIELAKEITTIERVIVIDGALHEPLSSSEGIKDSFLNSIASFLNSL